MSTNFSTEVPCLAGTETDNPHRYCCAIQFEYGGVTYQSCIKVDHHREWCSLTPVYSGEWANCGKENHKICTKPVFRNFRMTGRKTDLFLNSKFRHALNYFIQLEFSLLHDEKKH